MTQRATDLVPDLEWDLADRLRKSLRSSGIGVQQMADELGLDRNSVSRYINGHTVPARAALIVWAMRTGVPLEWLENGEDPRRTLSDEGLAATRYAIRDSNPEPADLKHPRPDAAVIRFPVERTRSAA